VGSGSSAVDGGSAFVISIHVTKIVLDSLSTMNSNLSTYTLATASVCSFFEFIYSERIVYHL